MKIKINIGKSQLEFEGRDFKEVVKEASAFSQCTQCKLCGSDNVSLDYHYAVAKQGPNQGKGYDYYKVKCMDCTGYAQLGEFKSGGFFAKKWEKYEAQQNQSQPQQSDDNFDDMDAFVEE